jgi:predicted molibdopterin-dependent oxidoreductase YjgC
LANEDLYAFRRFVSESVGAKAVDYWPRPHLVLSSDQNESLRALDSRLASIESVDRASLIVVVGADPAEREPVMELRVRKAVNRLGAKLLDVGSHDIGLTAKASAVIRWTPAEFAGVLTWLTRSGQLPEGVESAEYEAARSLLTGVGPIVVLYDDTFPDIPVPQKSEALVALAGFVDTLAVSHPVGVIPMLMTSNEMAARDFGLVSLNDGGTPWGKPVVDRLIAGEFSAAMIAGANPVKTMPELADALKNLDFCVVTELQLSETAAVADVVLPAASFAEKVGSVTNTSRRVQVFSQAVPGPGVARPDWQILVELSQRWETSLPYSTPEQILADVAACVPEYAGPHQLPSRYVEVGPEGFPVSAGLGDAAE